MCEYNVLRIWVPVLVVSVYGTHESGGAEECYFVVKVAQFDEGGQCNFLSLNEYSKDVYYREQKMILYKWLNFIIKVTNYIWLLKQEKKISSLCTYALNNTIVLVQCAYLDIFGIHMKLLCYRHSYIPPRVEYSWNAF